MADKTIRVCVPGRLRLRLRLLSLASDEQNYSDGEAAGCCDGGVAVTTSPFHEHVTAGLEPGYQAGIPGHPHPHDGLADTIFAN